MTNTTRARRPWRVAKLAETAYVAVRTLHRGAYVLFSASERTDADHACTTVNAQDRYTTFQRCTSLASTFRSGAERCIDAGVASGRASRP